MSESGEEREVRLLGERYQWERDIVSAQANHGARIANLEIAVAGLAPLVVQLTSLATRFDGFLDQLKNIEGIKKKVEELEAAEQHRKGADSRATRNALATGAGGGLIAWAIAWLSTHIK